MGLLDNQVIELLGRNRLIDQLLRAGLEVAQPLRDCGVDLIVYSGPRVPFMARPIQMKAASGMSFSLDRKYAKFPDLILCIRLASGRREENGNLCLDLWGSSSGCEEDEMDGYEFVDAKGQLY